MNKNYRTWGFLSWGIFWIYGEGNLLITFKLLIS